MPSINIHASIEQAKVAFKDFESCKKLIGDPWDMRMIDTAFQFLKDLEEDYDWEKGIEPLKNDPSQVISEWADGKPSVYTYDLLTWFGEDMSRLSYADEACQNGARTVVEMLLAGGALYHQEAAQAAINALLDNLIENET